MQDTIDCSPRYICDRFTSICSSRYICDRYTNIHVLRHYQSKAVTHLCNMEATALQHESWPASVFRSWSEQHTATYCNTPCNTHCNMKLDLHLYFVADQSICWLARAWYICVCISINVCVYKYTYIVCIHINVYTRKCIHT